MFFIGIFASPLPYMFLVAVYLSGYAFFFFEGQSGISEPDDNTSVDGWIAPAIPHPADSSGTCFFYNDNLSLADAPASLSLPVPEVAASVWVHLPDVHGIHWHLPGQYSIRPPPGQDNIS